MCLYAAVTYYDGGLTVLVNEDRMSLMMDLAENLYMGQEGYVAGVAFRPNTFKDEVALILKTGIENKEGYQEIAEEIMALINVTPFIEGYKESWTLGDTD